MTGQSPQSSQSPMSNRIESQELRSSITLVDFFRVWYSYRIWYLIGFLVITIGTLIWSKSMQPYYKSESTILVGRPIPLEQRVGISDIPGLAGSRNEQFQSLALSQIAERKLLSEDFLLSVTQSLNKPDPAYGNKALDLYGILRINDPNPDRRKMELVQTLRMDLMQVRQVQNTGLILLSAEMPTPYYAKRFVNSCLRNLQDYFINMEFGYYDTALKLYQDQLKADEKKLNDLAENQHKWYAEHIFDRYPAFKKEDDLWKAEIDAQSKWQATLRDEIDKLGVATGEQAKAAAQTIRILDWANLPLKVDRPKAGMNALIAGTLYTFLFMLGLVLISYLNWSRQVEMVQNQSSKMDM